MDPATDTASSLDTSRGATGQAASAAAGTARGPSRALIFWIQIVYLVALTLMAYFAAERSLEVPDYFGPIPRGVPWFGALGGVMISLAGVFQYRADWDPAYWPWHVSRPLVGALVAVVAVLAFQSGVLAINATLPEQGSDTAYLFYYLIGFVVGYREETFRRLIKRLADVVLEPAPERTPAGGGANTAGGQDSSSG
jgi:RsiW-degrading membrane proteinase PrsW (M82 family)